MDDFLTLTCSFCQTKFRIKTAYAHLRGRCPVCHYMIKAPQPRLYSDRPLQVSEADEPIGLLPEDDEWPEPGVIVVEQVEPGEYRFADRSPTPVAPMAEPVPSAEVIPLGPEYQKLKPKPPATNVPGSPTAEAPFRLVDETPPAKVKPPDPRSASSPKRAPAKPVEPLGEDDVPYADVAAPVNPVKPPRADAPGSPPPAAPPTPARSFDPLLDDILVPAPAKPPVADAPGSPRTQGPRFALPTPEPEEEPRPAAPSKPAAPIGLYNFKDVPPGASTAAIHPEEVGEFDHVHPAPQVAPLSELPVSKSPPPVAKIAPPDMVLLPPTEEETKPASMDEMYSFRLTEAESKPYRAPKPPDKPLWNGVWNFAWRTSSLKMLVWLTLGCTILAVCCAFLAWAVGAWSAESGSRLGAGLVFIFVGISTAMIGFLLGTYASACFFKIIEETAAGENDIVGPETNIGGWLGPFFQLGYLLFCGIMVCGLFGLCMGRVAGVILLLFLWPAVFNTFLLSSMAATQWWMILNTKVLEKLGSKLGVMFGLYVWTFVLLGIVIGTWSLAIAVSPICVILAGPALAICCLVYGRVLGRVGLLITAQDKKPKKKRKKKKRKAVEQEEEEEPDVEEPDDDGEPESGLEHSLSPGT